MQFDATDGLYGSRYYARMLRDSGRFRQFKFGVLWDMMGPKDLDITLSRIPRRSWPAGSWAPRMR